MRNLHKIVSEEYRIEALHLLRGKKKLEIWDCNSGNHHVFMLRCISKGITPVSIRLKPAIIREKARKIIRKQKGIFYR